MFDARSRSVERPAARCRCLARLATRWAGTDSRWSCSWPRRIAALATGRRSRAPRPTSFATGGVASGCRRSRHAHGADLGSRRFTADQPDPRHVGRRRGERMGRRLPQRRHPRRVRRNLGAAPGRPPPGTRSRSACSPTTGAHYFGPSGWVLDATTERWLRVPRHRRSADSGATVVNAGRDLLVFGGARFKRGRDRLLRDLGPGTASPST